MQELELRLLGPLQVSRGGVPLPLPPSRKVRALLAYLAVARGPVSREKLCDLLWDGPSDPRGELRWCLSRLRSMLDTNDRRRVSAVDDRISVDLDGCDVDALRLLEAVRGGVDRLGLQELLTIASRCDGDFLEGIVIHNCAAFEHWLGGRRSEFRSCRLEIVAEIGRRTPVGSVEGLPAARRWIDLAMLDTGANTRFLLGTAAQAHGGRVQPSSRCGRPALCG